MSLQGGATATLLGLSPTTTIQGPLGVLFLGFTSVSKPQGFLSLETVITAETLSWDQVAIPTAWPSPELEVKTDSQRYVWSLGGPPGPHRPAGWRGRVLLPMNVEHQGVQGALVSPSSLTLYQHLVFSPTENRGHKPQNSTLPVNLSPREITSF